MPCAAQAPKVQTRAMRGNSQAKGQRGGKSSWFLALSASRPAFRNPEAMPPLWSPFMSAVLQRTPLAETHVAAGARMVDFGGWDMPLAYGSQIEEHHAVRRDAGMFDVSHMLNVDVTGPQAMEFLQRLVANDVAKLTVPGKALYSCMLNPQGGIVDDLIIYFFAVDQ